MKKAIIISIIMTISSLFAIAQKPEYKKSITSNGTVTLSEISYKNGKSVNDDNWDNWWSKVRKIEKWPDVTVYFQRKGVNISSVNFTIPNYIDKEQFRIVNQHDAYTYKQQIEKQIKIDNVLEKSIDVIDESGINAVLGLYPNNRYKKQLIARKEQLIARREEAKRKDREQAEKLLRGAANYAQNVGEQWKENMQQAASSSSTTSNTNSSPSYNLSVSKEGIANASGFSNSNSVGSIEFKIYREDKVSSDNFYLEIKNKKGKILSSKREKGKETVFYDDLDLPVSVNVTYYDYGEQRTVNMIVKNIGNFYLSIGM